MLLETMTDVRNRDATPAHGAAISSCANAVIKSAQMDLLKAREEGCVWIDPFFGKGQESLPKPQGLIDGGDL